MKKFILVLSIMAFVFQGCSRPEPDLTANYVGVWEGVRQISYSGGSAAEKALITFAKVSNNTLSANIRFLGNGQDQVVAGGRPVIVYFDYGYNFKIDALKIADGGQSLQGFSAEVTGTYSDSKGVYLPTFTRKFEMNISQNNTGRTLTMKSAVFGETLRYTGTVELTKL